MGEDSDPWQLRYFNRVSNIEEAPVLAKQNANSMVFPTYVDPSGFFHLNSTSMPPRNLTGLSEGQKRFMIFDQSGDKTSLIYRPCATQFPHPDPTKAETDASNGNVNEEMHEDTEEIDALLYSDSDHDCENDEEEEEEVSTGRSPINATMVNLSNDEEEEVASSAVLQPFLLPAKRRRVEFELTQNLEDTVSLTHRGGDEDQKKAKREKIQETVGVLRRIIPGGKGKDTVAVLDEAIRYLRSLRLKARGLGVVSTLK